MAEALGILNFIQCVRGIMIGRSTVTTRIDQDFELRRKGLFDAVARSQSAVVGLAEKRTAIGVLSIRQICSVSKVTV
eukprot:11159140-Lingulodinium_polyedra.AAC.1